MVSGWMVYCEGVYNEFVGPRRWVELGVWSSVPLSPRLARTKWPTPIAKPTTPALWMEIGYRWRAPGRSLCQRGNFADEENRRL